MVLLESMTTKYTSKARPICKVYHVNLLKKFYQHEEADIAVATEGVASGAPFWRQSVIENGEATFDDDDDDLLELGTCNANETSEDVKVGRSSNADKGSN